MFNNPSKSKGFILFVVLGILTILGILFYAIHQRSGQRNLEAHRHYFNESSRTLAQAGIELFNGAFRTGIKTPTSLRLVNLLKNNKIHQDSFYGLFLLDIPKLNKVLKKHPDDDSKRILYHKKLLSYFSSDYKNMYKNLLKYYPKSDLTFNLTIEALPLYGANSFEDYQIDEEAFQDYVEKFVKLQFCAKVIYKNTSKSTCIDKSFKVYNLYNPVLSKFTFFHKKNSSHSFNSCVTLQSGRPYKTPIPLILNNGPYNNSEIPDDQMILGKLGDNKNNDQLEILTLPSSIKQSKDSIYRRGYLFFGEEGASDIKMTNGFTSFYEFKNKNYSLGQFFHLYNPAKIGTIDPDNGGASSPQFLIEQEFTSKERLITSTHSQEPKERESYGNILLSKQYIGYYKQKLLDLKEKEKSSSIHPFGTDFSPSRAKTVGVANLIVEQVVSYFLDADSTDNDEKKLQICSANKIYQSDAFLGIIPQATLFNYQTKMKIKNPNAIYASLVDCDPAISYALNEQWQIPFIFPEYSDYQKYMSKTLKIPMNETLD